jgi:isochorismate synthase
MDDRFHHCFQQLLTQNSCFTVHREPGKEISWIASKSIPKAKSAFDGSTGFWMAPFQHTENHPFYVIPTDFEATTNGFSNPESIPGFENYANHIPSETNQSVYEDQLERGIVHIQQGKLDKFIFSRCLHTESSKSIADIFLNLEATYPNALGVFVHHPIYGSWRGATPETLFQSTESHGKTQSLAGTQASGTQTNWGQKEIQEQAFVTDYIAQQLTDSNVSFESEGPITKQAGPVQHLLTTFQTSPITTKDQAVAIIHRLHPTPAVCGIPPDDARKLIQSLEQESRAYYTGFLGSYSSESDFHFFVNLRCMQVFENLLVLRLGGGITADSSVSAEWEETQLKAETLLQALR